MPRNPNQGQPESSSDRGEKILKQEIDLKIYNENDSKLNIYQTGRHRFIETAASQAISEWKLNPDRTV